MNTRALQKLSYGVYVVTSRKGDKLNGQIANTVFQVSSEPPQVAVSINKQNLTHEYIQASGAFAASILCEDTPLSFIGRFGFKSGKDTNKFEGVNYRIEETKAPIVTDYATAYLEVKVKQQADVGTHTVFIGEVVGAEVLTEKACMTYAFYHEIKRGATPKTAATYVAEAKVEAQTAAATPKAQEVKPKVEEAKPSMDKYVCTICGYIYDPAIGDPDGNIPPGTPFESIPSTWVCPVCGAGKDAFKKA